MDFRESPVLTRSPLRWVTAKLIHPQRRLDRASIRHPHPAQSHDLHPRFLVEDAPMSDVAAVLKFLGELSREFSVEFQRAEAILAQ